MNTCTIDRYGIAINGENLSYTYKFAKHCKVIEILMLRHDWVTRHEIYDWLYPAEYTSNPPYDTILTTLMMKARELLKPFEIEIEANRRQGFRIKNRPRVLVFK